MSTPDPFAELDGIIDGIRESASEPSDGVIENIPEENTNVGNVDEQGTASTAGLQDSAGNTFDPEKHATDANGNPSVTPTGKFRKRRNTAKSSIASVQQERQQQLATEAQREQSRIIGRRAADLFMASCVQFFGEDWIPQGAENFKAELEINEYNEIRKAFADAAESGEWKISPNKFLALTLLGYAGQRLATSEETHERLSWFASAIKPRFVAMGAWFKGFRRGRKNAAQSDSRNKREREDDTSKANVSESKAK